MYCNGMIEHEVEAGDTLYKLSKQYRTTVGALILQNPRINPYNLQIGMKIQICPGSDYFPGSEIPPQRPGNNMPGNNMPGNNMPGSNRPGNNMPGNNMPGNNMPGNNMPGNNIPGNNMPGNNMPGNNMPGNNMPGNNMPGNNMSGNAGFADRMRLAWLNHVYLLNSFINSVTGDMPDQQEVASALIRNAEEIADLFARYYPQNEVEQLQQLLLDHVELSGSFITESKAGNDARAESQKQRLYENASQLASMLAGATPEFDERYLKDMFDMHIDLEAQALAERMAGEYERQFQTLRKAQRQAIAMADYFSNGLRREAEVSGL